MNKSFIIFLLVISGVVTAQQKTLVCSDLLKDSIDGYLKRSLAEYKDWNVGFQGSYVGFKKIESDEADIGILALKSDQRKDLENNPNYIVTPFAFQTFFIGVNTANKLLEIKVDSLREIFSEDGSNQYRNWKEINSNFMAEPMLLVSSRNVGIGNQLFKAEVMRGKDYHVRANVIESHQKLSIRVSTTENSLALFSIKPQHENIRILSIVPENSKFAFNPSPQNLFYSDYPFYLSYMVVCRKEKVNELKHFYQVLYHNNLFDEIEKVGFIGIPIIERKKIISSFL